MSKPVMGTNTPLTAKAVEDAEKSCPTDSHRYGYMISFAQHLEEELARAMEYGHKHRLEAALAKRTLPEEQRTEAIAAPSPLGGLSSIIAEYDQIVNGRLDPRDAEADFVMRGSDWREIRKALGNIPPEERETKRADFWKRAWDARMVPEGWRLVPEKLADLIRAAQPLSEKDTPEWLRWCLDARAFLAKYDAMCAAEENSSSTGGHKP